jgi:hypothetical protein
MIKYEKWLMAIIMLAAVALFLIAGSAFAGQAVVTWTNPTARTDGSPLTNLAGTEVEFGTCSGTAFGTVIGAQAVTGTATTLTITGLTAGTYCFRAQSVDANNLHSAWSAVASKVVPVAPPNPPTIVTISTIAFQLRQVKPGVFALVRSGSVIKGESCDLLPGLGQFGVSQGKVAICGEAS